MANQTPFITIPKHYKKKKVPSSDPPSDPIEYLINSKIKNSKLRYTSLNPEDYSFKDLCKNKFIDISENENNDGFIHDFVNHFNILRNFISSNITNINDTFSLSSIVDINDNTAILQYCIDNSNPMKVLNSTTFLDKKLDYVSICSLILTLMNSIFYTEANNKYNVIFNATLSLWLYSLLAFLELPLTPEISSTFSDFYRELHKLKKGEDYKSMPIIDIFMIIISNVFNQHVRVNLNKK